jgi:hypothetical protein
VVAAKLGETNDKFKIRGLEVEYTNQTTSVPEPGTLATFAIALAGLGFAARRRKAA